MKGHSRFVAAALVAGLAVAASGGALAAAERSHQDHGGGLHEMTLNGGEKWQSDDALRAGMSGIRTELSAVLPRVHQGSVTAAEYAALADKVEQHVDQIITNCRLPPEADIQLHVALTEVLSGVDLMREQDSRQQGLLAVAEALNAYGDHFDHPGWEPLRL